MERAQGAEAIVEFKGEFVIKRRLPKRYRVQAIDEALRRERNKIEAKITSDAKKYGIPTPIIFDINDFEITMEYIPGKQLKYILNEELSEKIGALVGRLHSAGIIHGDLTTSNMILSDNKIYFIDFGLAFYSQELEARGVDVHVLFQTFNSTHAEHEKLIASFIKGYKSAFKQAEEVLARVKEIEARGRYIAAESD
jgi:Kae1-associated kinase Bud32